MSPRPHLDHIRRPQIIAAAAEAIAERGAATVRIADVAERIGASPSAVLYWFGSKDELLAAVLTSEEEAFNERLIARLSALSTPPEKLRAMIEACAEEYDWTLWLELWGRARRDEAARRARQRLDEIWREMLARVIRAGQASGSFASTAPADQLAVALASLIDGLALQATLGDPTTTRGFMLDTCLLAAERILGADLAGEAHRVALVTSAD